MAFQEVRTLSSSPGRTLGARASKSFARARSSRSTATSSSIPSFAARLSRSTKVCRCHSFPSKFGGRSRPNDTAAASYSSSSSTARAASGVQR